MSALQRIIDIKGSQTALAAVVGARQQSVGYWLKEGLPGEHVLKIAADVNYVITPHQLRPDLYPHPEDGLPEAMRNVAAPVAVSAQVAG